MDLNREAAFLSIPNRSSMALNITKSLNWSCGCETVPRLIQRLTKVERMLSEEGVGVRVPSGGRRRKCRFVRVCRLIPADSIRTESLVWTTPIGCPNHFATHGFKHLYRFCLVLAISIEDQIAGCAAFGKASRSCCGIQALAGCLGALKWRTRLRLSSITKKQYETQEVAVGTVKKSIVAIDSRWFFKKTNQTLRAPSLRPTRARCRETVRSESSKPSFNSSP